MKSSPLLYLTPNVFSLGGIERYNRYQVETLRQLLGHDGSRVISMQGPDPDGFDIDFDVDYAAGGIGLNHKIRFVLAAIRRMKAGSLYWSGLLHYAPISYALAKATSGTSIVNIYGWEMWTQPKSIYIAALKRSWTVADCHATLDDAVKNGLVNTNRSTVIWDPVDVDRFRPAQRSVGSR